MLIILHNENAHALRQVFNTQVHAAVCSIKTKKTTTTLDSKSAGRICVKVIKKGKYQQRRFTTVTGRKEIIMIFKCFQ